MLNEKYLKPFGTTDLDTAIRLRWALKDIRGNRTKLTPVSEQDMAVLIERGFVTMNQDNAELTQAGRDAIAD